MVQGNRTMLIEVPAATTKGPSLDSLGIPVQPFLKVPCFAQASYSSGLRCTVAWWCRYRISCLARKHSFMQFSRDPLTNGQSVWAELYDYIYTCFNSNFCSHGSFHTDTRHLMPLACASRRLALEIGFRLGVRKTRQCNTFGGLGLLWAITPNSPIVSTFAGR